MNSIPPELRARRDGIYDRVTRAGRARRRRRAAALVAVVAAVVAIPVAAVAVSSSHDRGPRVIASATTSSSATAATTSTTDSACHNSENPACGPLHYEPPLTNHQPNLILVGVSTRTPRVGETVTVTLRATDPDSYFSPNSLWCNDGHYTFGDPNGSDQSCIADCAAGPGYGTWDPPAPRPSDLTVHMDHAYSRPGTYTAVFTAAADVCGPRLSEATVAVSFRVSG